MPRALHRGRAAAAAVAATVLLLTGCGSEPPPSDDVPALATQLDRVDAVVEAGDYAAAREAVDALVAQTAQAQVAGDISDDQADRILEAARKVLDELPAGSPNDQTPDPTGTPGPSQTPEVDPFEPDDGAGEDGDDDRDQGKDDEKKKEGDNKEKEKDEDD